MEKYMPPSSTANGAVPAFRWRWIPKLVPIVGLLFLLAGVGTAQAAVASSHVYRPLGHHRSVVKKGQPVVLRFRLGARVSRATLVLRARGHGDVTVTAKGVRRKVKGHLRHRRLSINVTALVRHARRLVLRSRGHIRLRSVRLVAKLASDKGRAGPAPVTTHVLAAVGDLCSAPCSQGAKTAAAIASFSPERVLGLGDYQYQNAGNNGSTFQANFQPTFAGLTGIMIPAFGATHDTCNGSGAWACYPVSFFNLNGAPEVRGKLSDGQWGYSLDIGAWHVVVFNYDYSGGTGPVDADLNAHPSQCLLAIDHAPVIGSPSSEHPTNEANPWRQTLIAHGVDLILNGHQHFYERNVDTSGFTEITNGEGGIGHYSRSSTAPTAQAYDDTSFGPLKVTLTNTGWSTDFITDPGATAFTDHAGGGC
jgi:hypothetical protein